MGCLFLIGCAGNPRADRTAELAACQLISKSGDELARCLVMKYSWGADSAGPAKYAWQSHLDSLRREHEAQVVALRAAQREALGRQARPWAECILRQWDKDGSNYSFLPCQKQRPTWDAVSAYIVSHKLPDERRDVLIDAHVVSEHRP
jgi:hypothetical protein